MILAAHQPQFLPWLGYFDKMRGCDVFVLLDDAQFKKNEWQNRNRVWSRQGWRWLTVPVLRHFPEDIRSVRVNNAVDWRDKHWKTLSQTYCKARCFQAMSGPWERMYAGPWESLLELNLHTVDALRGPLGVGTRLELSSASGVGGRSTQRLVDLCRKFGADTYLAGAGGREYMELRLFEEASIRVVFQDYRPREYAQFGGAFVPRLSALDLVFHHGPGAAGLL